MFEISSSMAGLVDDLLAVSVARSNRSMLKVAAVAPAQLLGQVAKTVEPGMAQKGLNLLVEPAGELPPIQVDQERILRVFTNLLDNAVKFTERGGRIVLGAEEARAAVVFSIANSGPPLRAEEMEQLFQPFWQAGREDRRGAGLGLSICRTIIESHGGSVWTESAPGVRLKVRFLLPCVIPDANLLRRATDVPPADGPG
jgi:signal transduction histidine kinase